MQIYNKFLKVMARKKKIIQVPRKNVDLLAKALNVGTVTVWNALAFRSDSDNAQQIRRLALSSYSGIETYKLVND